MMAKKKLVPKKSVEEIVKSLEEKYGDIEMTKEEFDKALKKMLSTPKPKKPNH
jgi:hypothetical protein